MLLWVVFKMYFKCCDRICLCHFSGVDEESRAAETPGPGVTGIWSIISNPNALRQYVIRSLMFVHWAVYPAHILVSNRNNRQMWHLYQGKVSGLKYSWIIINKQKKRLIIFNFRHCKIRHGETLCGIESPAWMQMSQRLFWSCLWEDQKS